MVGTVSEFVLWWCVEESKEEWGELERER